MEYPEIKIAVVDDLAADRARLIQCIEAWNTQRGYLYFTEYGTGEALLSDFDRSGYQLVFLDIMMDGMDGIDLSRRLRKSDPKLLIVFLTSSPEYAFDAFPVHPFDYLIKPVDQEKLNHVMDEVVRSLAVIKDPEVRIRSARSEFSVPIGRIICVEADGHTVEVRTTDQQVLRSSMTYRDIRKLLDFDARFLECNRGLLINMDHVLSRDGGVVNMTDGSHYALRTKGQAELIAQLSQYQITRMKRGY